MKILFDQGTPVFRFALRSGTIRLNVDVIVASLAALKPGAYVEVAI